MVAKLLGGPFDGGEVDLFTDDVIGFDMSNRELAERLGVPFHGPDLVVVFLRVGNSQEFVYVGPAAQQPTSHKKPHNRGSRGSSPSV